MKGAGGLKRSTTLVNRRMTGKIMSLRTTRGLEGLDLRPGHRFSLRPPASGARVVNQWGRFTPTSLGNRPQKEDFSRRIAALFAGMRRVGNWSQIPSQVEGACLL